MQVLLYLPGKDISGDILMSPVAYSRFLERSPERASALMTGLAVSPSIFGIELQDCITLGL